MYLAAEVLRVGETTDRSVVETALAEFDAVYAFLYARVGNRADAEDLTQEVALKALPRLREGAPLPAVRTYLYATARSALATFWSRRLRLPESELPEDVRADGQGQEVIPAPENAAFVTQILESLSPSHRRILELRFLEGRSVREAASELGKTVGSVKVMQLRALRKAAAFAPVSSARINAHQQ